MYPTSAIVTTILADRERAAASARLARSVGPRKRFARRRRRLRLALRPAAVVGGR